MPAMCQAASDDSFDMRGPVGDLWKKALREDDLLKEEYGLVPRNFPAQRMFRRKRCEREFSAIQEHIRHVEAASETDRRIGRPLSLAQLVWELKSKRAAANYAAEAWRRHKAGEKFRTDQPWIFWNGWTKTLSIVYTENLFEGTHTPRHGSSRSEAMTSTSSQHPAAARRQ